MMKLIVLTSCLWLLLLLSRDVISSSSSSNTSLNSTFIIGDLHGDVACAKYWVERTGLVKESSDGWTFTDPTCMLVFMGDYVDKGPTSRQTLDYVKMLNEEFPKNVVTLLGNHELELLLDAKETTRDDWSGYGYHNLVYASVHPAEYLNYLLPSEYDESDHVVVDALYNAALNVYGNNQYHSVSMIPDRKNSNSIVHHVQPPSIQPLVSKRLELYQQRYLENFQSTLPLGSWLQSRPILFLTRDGTLLVHGGIPMHLAKRFLSRGQEDVEAVNFEWMQQAKGEHLNSFMAETELGQAIYTMLTYRGNHQGDNPQSSCKLLQKTLSSMKGIKRLGVGHTPDDSVRIECNGIFAALDSSLGRWIRATGNQYCRGDTTYASSNGRFVCHKIDSYCQGQIVRIAHNDGTIHIIDAESELQQDRESPLVDEL